MTAPKPESRRLFTVTGATRALPLVRRIVQDVVDAHAEWRDLVGRYELLAAGASAGRVETMEQRRLRLRIDEIAERISGYVRELEEIGCVLKGFEQGLVDFYGRYRGHLVCLCWRLGEESVSHWHELDAGFAGRQPVTAEFVSRQDHKEVR